MSRSVHAGFTIIEVLFVLAIAGIILAATLAVVPTLRRAGRNDSRKADIAALLSSIAHYELNNSGNLPAHDDLIKGAHLKFYDSTEVTIALGMHDASLDSDSDIEKVAIYNYHKCDPSAAGKAIVTGAGYRDIVALYALEGNKNPALQCTQL